MPLTLRTDGDCVRGTRANLVDGLRSAPISADAVGPIFDQASDFIGRLVSVYEDRVAPGEVGAGGTGIASEDPVIDRCPTALLYGRVQSGKTASMIAAAAYALDNCFRIVVVLTANNVALVKQTTNRFKSLSGPAVLSTAAQINDFSDRRDEVQEDLAEGGGVVIVAGKDVNNLARIYRFLQEVGAGSYPALIFDDEADSATPDTTLAARSAGRTSAPQFPSTTFRRVIENAAPNEIGESIREALLHHVYVQVTATPFVLLLQVPDSPIRPEVVHLLEPGAGYHGGEEFFGQFKLTEQEQRPPLVLVDSNEAQLLVGRRYPPAGLSASIAYFLVAAAARAIAAGRHFPQQGYKFLAHTSHLTIQHDHLADVIRRHLSSMQRQLRKANGNATTAIDAGYQELRRTEEQIAAVSHEFPTFEDVLEYVANTLDQAEVIKVNATTGDPEYGPTYNFVVGGNILGRGITIDDLLVTYYLREAQTAQMDTVWQHGRMFGYRAPLMPYTRVFLPSSLAETFAAIHEAEVSLRHALPEIREGAPAPVVLVPRSRATRPNALNAGRIETLRPRTQIFPRYTEGGSEFRERVLAVRDRLADLGVPLEEAGRQARFVAVDFDTVAELIQLVPARDDENGRWDVDGIASALEVLRPKYEGRASLYVRAFTIRPERRLRTGVLSGDETRMARDQGVPVLALAYWENAASPELWHPTVVMPSDMPVLIYSDEA